MRETFSMPSVVNKKHLQRNDNKCITEGNYNQNMKVNIDRIERRMKVNANLDKFCINKKT
jgi:hypothetical protein